MATSAENDGRDEREDADEGEADESEVSSATEEASAKDEAKQPAAKTAKAEGKRSSQKSARVRPAPPQQSRSLGKSMLLFMVIIGGVAGGFALLGGGDHEHAPARPKWKAGEDIDVEITLVPNDRTELGCSAGEEIAGKHCAFETTGKMWSKGDNNDDKKLLKPYTTVDHVQFVAAGMWSEPALAADKLPNKRFSVKCKYKVDGMFKNLAVRWESTGQWYPVNEWHAGSVTDCKLVP